MRRFTSLFIASIVLNYCAFAQDVDTTLTASTLIPINEKGYAEYTEVVTVDSISKDDLFVGALEWMNKTYKSGKSVIQTTDKEGGMIIGNANTQSLMYNNMGFKVEAGYFSYTIAIYCKENRYKYVIDNITYNKGEMILSSGADLAEKYPHNWGSPKSKQTNREWAKFQVQTDLELRLIIKDLKVHMQATKKKDNW